MNLRNLLFSISESFIIMISKLQRYFTYNYQHFATDRLITISHTTRKHELDSKVHNDLKLRYVQQRLATTLTYDDLHSFVRDNSKQPQTTERFFILQVTEGRGLSAVMLIYRESDDWLHSQFVIIRADGCGYLRGH